MLYSLLVKEWKAMDAVYLVFNKTLKGFCHPQYSPGEQAAHVLDEFTLQKKNTDWVSHTWAQGVGEWSYQSWADNRSLVGLPRAQCWSQFYLMSLLMTWTRRIESTLRQFAKESVDLPAGSAEDLHRLHWWAKDVGWVSTKLSTHFFTLVTSMLPSCSPLWGEISVKISK